MRSIGGLLTVVLLYLAPHALAAQEGVRVQLEARGLPPELVGDVVALAADATAQGVPTEPITNKAIEGWAKHVPPQRITAALRQFFARMMQAQIAVRASGLADPPGELLASAAEAMGRGFTQEHVGAVVEAAPEPAAAGHGLSVATALRAQGLEPNQAIEVVTGAMHRGQPVAEILDMPSLARAMQARGLSPGQVGEQLMLGGGGMQGAHGRPPGSQPREGQRGGRQGPRRP
jgi:hypothetical protein